MTTSDHILQLITETPRSFNEILQLIIAKHENQPGHLFLQYVSYSEIYSSVVTGILHLLSEKKITKSDTTGESLYSVITTCQGG